MLQRETWLFITDGTNVKWVKIFQLYKGFMRKVTIPGFFIKGSARVVEPPRLEYKGFKYKYSLKGNICRSWIIRSRGSLRSNTGGIIRFGDNSGINIKKKNNPKSKFLLGPISRILKRKKLLTLFRIVL